MNLQNKIAIITGARRGIGRGIALALAKAGCHVVVSDLDQADCQKVVKEIEALGVKALAVACDVSQKAAVDELINQASYITGQTIVVDGGWMIQ